MNQQTIKHKVSITGTTLHTGDNATLVLSPGSVDNGIVFYKNSSTGRNIISLSAREVIKTSLSTNIGIPSSYVSTIEHLMSVLHILGIDNLDITVNGNEIPILDGSAIQYYHLIKSAGIIKQNKTRSYIIINEPIRVQSNDSHILATPYDGFMVDMTIDFDHPVIGKQQRVYDRDNCDYETEIAPARTFGILSEIQHAVNAGLLKGGSIDNAIVLDHQEVINPPLRYPDEFIRHKILDFIGDMYVDGSIKGWFDCHLNGHALNNDLMRKISKRIKSND